MQQANLAIAKTPPSSPFYGQLIQGRNQLMSTLAHREGRAEELAGVAERKQAAANYAAQLEEAVKQGLELARAGKFDEAAQRHSVASKAYLGYEEASGTSAPSGMLNRLNELRAALNMGLKHSSWLMTMVASAAATGEKILSPVAIFSDKNTAGCGGWDWMSDPLRCMCAKATSGSSLLNSLIDCEKKGLKPLGWAAVGVVGLLILAPYLSPLTGAVGFITRRLP